MKYFVLTDVHSSFDAMMEALNGSGYDENNDNHKIIFLGDAFDKGDKPLEVYLFFRRLIENNKMIWIEGNHDTELKKVITTGEYTRDCHNTAIQIAKYYDNSILDNAKAKEVAKVLRENGVLDFLNKSLVNYYELDKYVFTHGFLPMIKGKLDPNWREAEWKTRTKNGMKFILKDGIKIPGKILVCGHVGAYYGHLITKYPDLDVSSKEFEAIKRQFIKDKNNYKSFISDDVINLDANGYKTGFINVLVIEA